MYDFNDVIDRICYAAAAAGDSACKFAKKAAAKTEVYVDRAKLRLRLAEVEAEMEENYIDIGKIAYNSTRGGAPDNDQIKKDVDRLDALTAESEDLKERLGNQSK